MKVQCIKNTGDENVKEYIRNMNKKGLIKRSEDIKFPVLKIGEEYLVFGVLYKFGDICYLIVDPETDKPWSFPANQFKMICNSIPSGWIFNHDYDIIDDEIQEYSPLIGYYEFIHDKMHYPKLEDRDEDALSIFREQIEFYRQQIEPYDFVRLVHEFPEEGLQRDTIGMVTAISDDSEKLYEVTFFGDKDKTVIVPRGFIAFEMKNE